MGSTLALSINRNDDEQIGWLMYESRQGGGRTLYRAFPDGSVIQRLTELPNTAVLSLSPNGRWLVYYNTFSGSQDEFSLYRMRINGRGLEQLTDSRTIDASQTWSPDGEWLTYMAYDDGLGSIYKMRPDGSSRQRLTNHGDDGNPMWSPDGEWVAYMSTQNGSTSIYKMRPDGSENTEIVDLDENRLTIPDSDRRLFWSPDGEWIAFLSLYFRGSNKYVFRVHVESGQVEQLTEYGITGINQQDQFPSWSPDGEWLTFASEVHADTNISVMQADGSEKVQITNIAGYNAQPLWSPDGEWIVFVSFRDDKTSIMRMRQDGSDVQTLLQNVTVGGWMAWSQVEPLRLNGWWWAWIGIGGGVAILGLRRH